MAKLYLIRRNLDSFAGPMTLSEMKEAYKRMQFGLQDEVAGHCGDWVSFENLEKIKKHYPEVARIVNEEMLAGWGVSEHTGKVIVEERTRRLPAQANRNFAVAVAFLVVAVIAFAAAVYMANSGRFSGKLREPPAEPTIEAIQALVERRDVAAFDLYVEESMDFIIQKVIQQKTGESPWLPYLRQYAFTHDGTVRGLDPRILRGSASASAPTDCSLKTWRKRWRTSVKQWQQQAYERKLVRSHWGRVLAWDPHWIRRRDHKGWLPGGSYYLGCLAMADRALAEVSADPSLVTTAADWERYGLSKLRQRLLFILETVRDGASNQTAAYDPIAPMTAWTCYESSRDLKALQKCRDGMTNEPADQWAPYSEERYGWNVIRLASREKGAPTPELMTLITQATAKLTRADFFTRFDYRAELRFARGLGKPPGPIEKTVERTQSEFPEVRFSP